MAHTSHLHAMLCLPTKRAVQGHVTVAGLASIYLEDARRTPDRRPMRRSVIAKARRCVFFLACGPFSVRHRDTDD